MTDTTDIAALTRPVRDRYDWSNAVWRDCDQCGKQHTGTVTAEDGSQICAHCADQLYWSAWQVLAERALDLLEAERQRAGTRIADLEKRLRYTEETLIAANDLLTVAEAEIAALKAKLANPVVVPAGYSARAGHPFHEGERNVMIPNKHGDWLSRFEVEHAIHVAGFQFTVKGE